MQTQFSIAASALLLIATAPAQHPQHGTAADAGATNTKTIVAVAEKAG
jgi:hypothetical protein